MAPVNSDHPHDAGLAFGKHEYYRKSGKNTYCKVSNKRYKRSEVIDNALKQLSRNHPNTANSDPIRPHVQAQNDAGHIRWFVAARTIDGDISYRLKHLDFRSYRQGRKQLGRFFENSRSTTSSTGEAQVCTTELDAPTPEGRAHEMHHS